MSYNPKASVILSNQAGSSSALAQPQPAPEGISLIDLLRGGYNSNELWTISTGIREFDLQYYSGTYYLAYDDGTQCKLRHASTISGLSSAGTDATVSGRYPSILFDGSIWHLWNYNGSTAVHHFTAATYTGTWTDQGSIGFNVSDPQARQSPLDGQYYMTYTSLSTYGAAGMLTASTPSGTWTDLGLTFSALGSPPYAQPSGISGQFDPTPIFWNGRAYVAFTAIDGSSVGRMAIVEVDPSNSMKALSSPIVLVEPLETWQISDSAASLSNPIWLDIQTQPGQGRLYYTHKPGSTYADGPAYIQVGTPPPDGRRALGFTQLNTATGLDTATGIIATSHGGATWGPGGLSCAATPSGAYGYTNLSGLSDLTVAIQFLFSTTPGSDALLIRVSPASMGTDEAAIWVNSSGILKAKIIGSTTLTLTGTTTMSVNTAYTAILRRLGSEVRLYLDTNEEANGTQGDALTGIVEWSVANDKGATQSAGEQLLCTVFNTLVTAEALPLSVDPFNGQGRGSNSGYSLPTASTTVLGGVKVDGSTITIASGVISSTGGGGGAMTQIQAQTLASPASSITFSSISGSYNSLRLEIQYRSSTSATFDSLLLQFNGDTGSNYDHETMQSFGTATPTSAEGFAQTSIFVGYGSAATSPSDDAPPGIIEIPNYSSTVFNKNLFARTAVKEVNSTGGLGFVNTNGNWRNTAAITSIVLTLTSGANFVTGTKAILWGIT